MTLYNKLADWIATQDRVTIEAAMQAGGSSYQYTLRMLHRLERDGKLHHVQGGHGVKSVWATSPDVPRKVSKADAIRALALQRDHVTVADCIAATGASHGYAFNVLSALECDGTLRRVGGDERPVVWAVIR